MDKMVPEWMTHIDRCQKSNDTYRLILPWGLESPTAFFVVISTNHLTVIERSINYCEEDGLVRQSGLRQSNQIWWVNWKFLDYDRGTWPQDAYWLKEEKAPDGYIKQQAATKIEIIPTYYPEVTWTETEGTGNDAYTYTVKCDDLLKSYVVKVDNVQIAEYTVNYAEYVGEDPNKVPANDTVDSTDGTTNGGIVISNNGPVTTSTTGATTNTEGKILNTQGAELPSTGGIGTTLFYIIGAILVLGAGILLVTRRRMNAN